ncbi:MAG: sigma-54 dependent transcriptional regulator [Candidatus Wallbacteria bacterium]
MPLIYIVDDEENMCRALKISLEIDGFNVLDFTDAPAALEFMKNNPDKLPDIVVSDLKMPEMGGIEFLIELKKIDCTIPFIIMTAYATIKNAVSAIKEGAFDYILKPFEPNELKLLIKKAISENDFSKNNEIRQDNTNIEFIGESEAIKSVLEKVASVAFSRTTVLITGESGTGKELIAKLIHQKSERKKKPFVKINCAAIPENLLESELFGHKKGSFTGALTDKIGKFEAADTGTIFLDEIGDMSLSLQVKLLRVLQERQIEKIGDNKLITIDVRIIAATNQDLQKLITEGNFREDLYYRLNVFPIKLPPLRQRREDIMPLTEFFVNKFNLEFNKNVVSINNNLKDFLLKYNFSGNIRELSNIIERAMILARGTELNLSHIDKDDPLLKAIMSEAKNEGIIENNKIINILEGQNGNLTEAELGEGLISLEQIERQHIIDILKTTGWHRGKAAEILKIDRSTLYRMMKKYNIEYEA